jgi:hypothetical protein
MSADASRLLVVSMKVGVWSSMKGRAVSRGAVRALGWWGARCVVTAGAWAEASESSVRLR